MKRLRLLALLLVAAIAACSSTVDVVPVVPVQPVPPVPAPVDPPAPEPVGEVVPYATAHAITPGMTRAVLVAHLGLEPVRDVRQDDGTTILEWAALGPAGEARWLDVQLDASGRVLGYALVPRLPPPAPVTSLRSLPDGPIHDVCEGEECLVPVGAK